MEPVRVRSGSPFEDRIGFSRAIRVGNRCLVSGTTAVWPDGSCPDDVVAQAERCFEIIAAALDQLGAGLEDIIRTRTYLLDPADAEAVAGVHARRCGPARPAATMIVVAGLLDPRWRVEIEAEAAWSER